MSMRSKFSPNIKMIITDLDGTLLNPEHKISTKDMQTLEFLETLKIIRVIATGRSVYSVRKVLSADFPIDYLIFSCGAGILNYKNNKILREDHLYKKDIKHIAEYLLSKNIDFMLHEPIPQNHYFYYHLNHKSNQDFLDRLKIYQPFAKPLHGQLDELTKACQFVVINPGGESSLERILKDLHEYSVIRTTSPLDHNTIWIEIFPKNVSKGQSSAKLAEWLGVNQSEVMSIGNDYNDLDLLSWAGNSYVVENAPVDLKGKFKITQANHQSAFTAAVSGHIDLKEISF